MGINSRFSSFFFSFFVSFVSAWITASSEERPFVVGKLQYELGNQMFQVAATAAVALDHGYEAYFPDLINCPWWGIPDNYRYVFWRLNPSQPQGDIEYIYHENGAKIPIPARPNMQMEGYFQSEEYFAHRKEEILRLFAPSAEIMDYLELKYAEILAHPNTVAIHVRTYIKDYGHVPTREEMHAFPGIKYYEKAVRFFPEDSLFVLCSDRIDWCRAHLSHIAKNLIFIEGNHHVYDLYLMSLCKHNITGHSTFSWWAAYLNRNPEKIVITPDSWFGVWWKSITENIVPKGWIRVSGED